MAAPRKGHLRGKIAKESNPTCSWGFSRHCWEAGGWERGNGGCSLCVGRERSQRICGYPTRELKEQRLPEVPARTGDPPAGAGQSPWPGIHVVLQHTQRAVPQKGPARALAGRL